MIIEAESKLYSDAIYKPDIDGQELIGKLWEMCTQGLRWDCWATFLKYTPRELAIEGLICYMAWVKDDDFFKRAYIYLLGYEWIPYVKYRCDNPPKGNWDIGWYDFHLKVEQRYKEVCMLLLDASEKELLRD